MTAAERAPRRDGAALDVSVSVVTFDSAGCLGDLVAALRAQTGVSFEAFFVDNGSGDATAEMLRGAGFGDLILNPTNVGFGRAHNQNLSRFRGRHVVILNPDVRFGTDLLAHLVGYLDTQPGVAIAGPRVLEGPERREFAPRRWYPGEGMVPLEDRRPHGEIAWVSGCCMIVRRPVLEALGGFDPDYFLYAEEIDLCLRARRAGHRIGWCPSAAVHHLQHQSQPDTSAEERSRLLFRGIVTFWEKHYRPTDVRRMLRFQLWACEVLLSAGPVLRTLSRRWPALAEDRLRARRAVCGERLRARGSRGRLLAELPLRILLRQVELLARWVRQRRLPLDDY